MSDTAFLSAGGPCILSFGSPLEDAELQFLRDELAVDITQCEKSEAYRWLLASVDPFYSVATIYQVADEETAILLTLRFGGEGNLLRWYNAGVDRFVEENSIPYSIYSNAFIALERQNAIARELASELQHKDNVEVAAACALVETQRQPLKVKADDILDRTLAMFGSS